MSEEKLSWAESLNNVSNYEKTVGTRDEDLGSFLEFDPIRRENIDSSNEINNDIKNHLENNNLPSLEGIPFGVKDNIAVRNFRLTCGSKILENFLSPYDATAVKRLIAAGARPVGKTNLDEFGMGSSTDNSALKSTNNPWDHELVAGGSSGGSAAAVAAGLVPFALGSDTGGSIRQPASFCGVYGLKPTYGSVSRYGLVAYASSLEVIGILSRDLDLCHSVYEVMKGEDEMDQSSTDPHAAKISKEEIRTISYLSGDLGLDAQVQRTYDQALEELEALGYELKPIELKMLDYTVPTYYTIATAEASANLARFNGVRYGYRPVYSENPEELVRQARDEGFGAEVKLRVLLGTYVLRSGFQDQYYHRAQKIRTAIRNEMDSVFEKSEALMMPVFPTLAFAHGDAGLSAFQQKMADKFTSTANLTGQPALSVPFGLENHLPGGVQFMAPAFHEHRLFSIAKKLQKNHPPLVPDHYPELYAVKGGN